jgi:branched-chain amino acid transport system substrate-binding protein
LTVLLGNEFKGETTMLKMLTKSRQQAGRGSSRGAVTDRLRAAGIAALATLSVLAMAPTASFAQEAKAEPYRVGILTSMSGQYRMYGAPFADAMGAGVRYATNGTGLINGHPVEIIVKDVAGDPGKAIAAATELVGQGVTILAGPTDSAVGIRVATFAAQNKVLYLNGMAGSDALVGINKYTFQTARKASQLAAAQVEAYRSELKPGVKTALVASNTEFGKSSLGSLSNLLKPTGVEIIPVTDAITTQSFSAVMQQIQDANPDIVYSAWVGQTTGALWKAFNDAKLQERAKVVTELLAKENWPIYGSTGSNVAFVTPYYYQIADNEAAQFLQKEVADKGLNVGASSAPGFVAGQMIVHALTNNDYKNVDGLVSSLEDWSAVSVQGSVSVRKKDHLLMLPIYVVKMTKYSTNPDEMSFEIERVIEPDLVAPPEK